MQTQIGLATKAGDKVADDPEAASFYGFKSDVNNSTATVAYNFYAEGDAPNPHFAGDIVSDGAIQGNGVSSRGDVTGANWGGNQYAGFYCRHSSVTGVIGSQGFTADSIAAGSNGDAIHFFSRGTDSDNNFNYAFRTSFNTSVGSGKNFAFYASGTARSYFNGNITVSQGANDDDIPINNSGDVGTSIMAGSVNSGRVVSTYANGSASPAMRYYTRVGHVSGQIMRFFYAPTLGTGSSTNCGNIVLTSANSINF